jgi:hypothetical protein
LVLPIQSAVGIIYSETSIHRFRWGSEKETMDLGKQWGSEKETMDLGKQ